MCFEADNLLGQIIDALDATGARSETYVLMISDHGEDNTEHRQCGKNNMYDSASRVAMLLSGPGITPGQIIPNLASLNDIFPTILGKASATCLHLLACTTGADRVRAQPCNAAVPHHVDMASLQIPDGLAGSSLLPLATGAADPTRKDYITAQYHSVFSVTGEFMIRQGDLKLIVYGANQFDWQYPAQLFNLSSDPWELHDIAASSAADVARLSALLETDMGSLAAIDVRCKTFQRELFKNFSYEPQGGAAGCQKLFTKLYGSDFNASDAAKVETWLGAPCPWTPPPPPAPPDPTCAHGIKDASGTVCCAASCKVCAHPSSACQARPGGAYACCPSIVTKGNQSCATHGAPCVLNHIQSKLNTRIL